MIAPEPYFRPRGTPFSIADRLNGLNKLGYSVHLVTYPFGENRGPDDVHIDRIPHIPGIKDVRVGPSFTKIPLDFVLLLKTLWILIKNRKYAAIHTHEEGALIGVIGRLIFRVPHIYDMHSSLYQQMSNFEFTKNPFLLKIMEWLEKLFLKYSEAVIVICPSLEEHAKKVSKNREGIFLIENLPLWEDFNSFPEKIIDRKQKLGITNQKIIFYAGTFEPYQGLDLLLESAEMMVKQKKDFIFLVLGGNDTQVADFKDMIHNKNLENWFKLTGMVPPDHIPDYAEISDVLVSPRKSGTNTPLKIYSYLKSGKPILATNLTTHTQVLDENVAQLVDPNPDSMADGLLYLLNNPEKAGILAQNAQKLAAEKYTPEIYLDKLKKTYDFALRKMGVS